MENLKMCSEKYILAAVLHGKATLDGDHRAANKQYHQLIKIYRKLEKNPQYANILIGNLFSHPNASVKTWAATHALGLQVRVDEALRVLQKISEDQSIGVVRLDAEMTLKEWSRRGKLEF